MEIAFFKRQKDRGVDGVLLLQGSQMKKRDIRKEVAGVLIFVADFVFSKSRNPEIRRSRDHEKFLTH